MNFVFRNGDDAVDKTLHVIKIDGPDTLGTEPVGNGARDLFGRELDDFAGAQAGLRVGC